MGLISLVEIACKLRIFQEVAPSWKFRLLREPGLPPR